MLDSGTAMCVIVEVFLWFIISEKKCSPQKVNQEVYQVISLSK
jgi:hypothetical protein